MWSVAAPARRGDWRLLRARPRLRIAAAVAIVTLAAATSAFSQDLARVRPAAVVPVVDDATTRAFTAEFQLHLAPWEAGTLAEKDVWSVAAIDAARVLAADEVVIGVAVGKESRAYPIRTLAIDEVLNDSLGGAPLALTWCKICHAAVVYDRRLESRTLTFGNYRCVWRGSLVMYDVETASLWVQASGISGAGPQRGRALAPLPASTTTWGQWREEHPTTTVAMGDWTKGVPRAANRVFDPSAVERLGVVVRAGGAAKIVPLRELAQRIVVDRVGAVPFVALYSRELGLLQVFRRDVAGASIEFAMVPRADGPGDAAGPPLLAEVGGARRWRADTGRPFPADATWPALERVVAYPLRLDHFDGYFPARSGAAPSNR